MSEQRDREFVQHSIDTGLESMQGNPFLAQRIMNQERTEQPVMKKKISFAFILAMILLLVSIATAVAGAVNEDFNAWLYRIWPEMALKLMPVNMSCVDNGIKMEIISAVANNEELYITYSMEDLEGDRLSGDITPFMYVDSFPEYLYHAHNENPFWDKEKGKTIFGEHYVYKGNIATSATVLKAHVPNFTSAKETSRVDLFPYLERYGNQVKTMIVPEDSCILEYADYDVRGHIPSSMQVIDSSYCLEIPLSDTVYLSGLGMVDGLLHVQLHYVNHYEFTTGDLIDMISYCPDEPEIILRDKNSEYLYDSTYHDWKINNIKALGWGSQPNDPEIPEWVEYIFTADTSALSDDQEFYASIIEIAPILGSWDAEIPVRLIQKAN